MDFAFTEEQEAVRELAGRIFGRPVHPRAAEGDRGRAGRRGPLRPRAVGRAGRRRAARHRPARGRRRGRARLRGRRAWSSRPRAGRRPLVPVIETMVYGAGPIDRFGTADAAQPLAARRWSPASTVLTAALVELVGDLVVPGGAPRRPPPPQRAGRLAARRGQGLRPGRACWPTLVLVPATARRGRAVGPGGLRGPTDAAGSPASARTRRPASPRRSWSCTAWCGRCRAVLAARGPTGRRSLDWLRRAGHHRPVPGRGRGVARRCRLTAEYTKTREQFGKPIATFQAVGQRAADAYVDAEAVRLTAWQAAWRLAAGPAGRRPRWPWPSTGRPRAASGSSTPPPTSTAGSGSTGTTRCTATSC